MTNKQAIKNHITTLTRANLAHDYEELGNIAVQLFELHDLGKLELSKEDVKNLNRLLPHSGWHVHQLLNQDDFSIKCSFKQTWAFSHGDIIRIMKAVYFTNLKNELYLSVLKIIDTLQDKI